MDDEALIGLFFARDERVISALDLQYGALCRTLSRRILKREEDAEECVWDAYLGVWNAVPPARPNPLRAFVCRIVRNVSMHRYWYLEADKRSAGCTVPLEELSKSLSGEDTAESLFDARELAAAIMLLALGGACLAGVRYFGVGSARGADERELTKPLPTEASSEAAAEPKPYTSCGVIANEEGLNLAGSSLVQTGDGAVPETFISPGYMAVFARTEAEGWEALSGETVSLSFTLADGQTIDMEAGYVQNGVYHKLFRALGPELSTDFTTEEAGTLYFCLTNRSSRTAVIENGSVIISGH